jgi:hypothetical protein
MMLLCEWSLSTGGREGGDTIIRERIAHDSTENEEKAPQMHDASLENRGLFSFQDKNTTVISSISFSD